MTHVAEATAVKSPPDRSRALLADYLEGHQDSNDGRTILRLRTGTTPGGLHLEHEVEAKLSSARVEPLEYRIDLSWKPTGTKLLPSFKGTLRFQWDEDYGNTWLVIEGGYEPPLGEVGKVFDAIAGQRIARATIRALLDDLRSIIEVARAAEVGKS